MYSGNDESELGMQTSSDAEVEAWLAMGDANDDSDTVGHTTSMGSTVDLGTSVFGGASDFDESDLSAWAHSSDASVFDEEESDLSASTHSSGASVFDEEESDLSASTHSSGASVFDEEESDLSASTLSSGASVFDESAIGASALSSGASVFDEGSDLSALALGSGASVFEEESDLSALALGSGASVFDESAIGVSALSSGTSVFDDESDRANVFDESAIGALALGSGASVFDESAIGVSALSSGASVFDDESDRASVSDESAINASVLGSGNSVFSELLTAGISVSDLETAVFDEPVIGSTNGARTLELGSASSAKDVAVRPAVSIDRRVVKGHPYLLLRGVSQDEKCPDVFVERPVRPGKTHVYYTAPRRRSDGSYRYQDNPKNALALESLVVPSSASFDFDSLRASTHSWRHVYPTSVTLDDGLPQLMVEDEPSICACFIHNGRWYPVYKSSRKRRLYFYGLSPDASLSRYLEEGHGYSSSYVSSSDSDDASPANALARVLMLAEHRRSGATMPIPASYLAAVHLYSHPQASLSASSM
jgi:hypothetical protein